MKNACSAMLWGLFVFASYALVASWFMGTDLIRDRLAFSLVGLTFCTVAFLGSWLVPRLSGPAKLLGIVTTLGIGASVRTEGYDPAPFAVVMILGITSARMMVDLFFPRAHWSQIQLWTALLSGPVAFVMMTLARPKGNLLDAAGIFALWSMSLGLAAVAPRRWVS